MSKSDLYFIVGNLFVAQGLRNKPFVLIGLSVFYSLLYLISISSVDILK